MFRCVVFAIFVVISGVSASQLRCVFHDAESIVRNTECTDAAFVLTNKIVNGTTLMLQQFESVVIVGSNTTIYGELTTLPSLAFVVSGVTFRPSHPRHANHSSIFPPSPTLQMLVVFGCEFHELVIKVVAVETFSFTGNKFGGNASLRLFDAGENVVIEGNSGVGSLNLSD